MKRVLVLSVLLLIALGPAGQATIPRTMSYQGLLRTAGGPIVPDGNYTLTFRLYNVEVSGTPLWEEVQTVQVQMGVFNALLGRINPLSLLFNEPYYLGISIGNEAELTPRTPLASSPYSFYSKGGGGGGGISGGGEAQRIALFTDSAAIGSSVIQQSGSDVVIGVPMPGRSAPKAGQRDTLRLPVRAAFWVNDPTNAIVGSIAEPNAAADDRVAVYGYRTRNVANNGIGYGYAQTNAGVVGANWWGDQYTFGTIGYCYNDYTLTGGVLGSNWNGELWGSLAYKDQNSVNWGLYTPNAAHVGSNLDVGGSASAAGGLSTGGNAQVGGNLNVTGTASATAGLSTAGNSHVGGNLDVSGTLSVTGNATVGGRLNKALFLSGAAYNGAGNVAVDMSGANMDQGEVHFGNTGNNQWVDVWLIYSNGYLMGNYLKYDGGSSTMGHFRVSATGVLLYSKTNSGDSAGHIVWDAANYNVVVFEDVGGNNYCEWWSYDRRN